MKLEIKGGEFVKLLQPTQSLIEKRKIIPILSKVLLKVTEDEICLFATDQDNSLQAILPTQNNTPGATCVDSKNLFEIIKELPPNDKITISKKSNKEGIEIKSKTSTFNMVGVKESDFPVFPTLKSPEFFKIKKHVITRLIEQTSYCVSTDETRYHLNGVFLEQNDQKLRMVATDGHRLSYSEEQVEGLNLKEGIIIPKKGLYEIQRLLTVEDDESLNLAVHPPRLLIRFSHFLLSVKLIEGKYPNYRQLLPKNSKIKGRVEKEKLAQSLRRVSLLSNIQSRNSLFEWNKNEKTLTLSSQHPEMGDARETLKIKDVNGDVKIRFNARYILESLNHIEDDEVEIEMNTSSTPGTIKGVHSKGVAIVMPMKL